MSVVQITGVDEAKYKALLAEGYHPAELSGENNETLTLVKGKMACAIADMLASHGVSLAAVVERRLHIVD